MNQLSRCISLSIITLMCNVMSDVTPAITAKLARSIFKPHIQIPLNDLYPSFRGIIALKRQIKIH
jgi:hypothetical protein